MASTLDGENWIETVIEPGQSAVAVVLDEIVRTFWKFSLLPGRVPTIHVKGRVPTSDLCHVIAVLEDLVTVTATRSSLVLHVKIDDVKLLVQIDPEEWGPQA